MSNKLPEKLEELSKKTEDLVTDFETKAKELLTQVHKEVFNAYPNLLALRWAQYAPSFNDGDPCDFRTAEVYIATADTKIEEGTDNDSEDSDTYEDTVEIDGAEYGLVWKYGEKDDGPGTVLGKIHDQLESVLRSAYGESSQITLFRNGEVEVDDNYDCGY